MAVLSRNTVMRFAPLLALLVVSGPALGLAGSVGSVASHRLQLPSGEVLLGAPVGEADGQLIFRSQLLGQVKVAKEGAVLTALSPAEPQTPAVVPVVTAKPAKAPTPSPAVKWTRSIEAGYTYQARGTLVSTHSTYVRAEVARETKSGRISLEARYLYGSQAGTRSADKFESAFKLRHNLSGRLDIRNNFSYGYDYLKDLSHQFEDVLGLTWHVFKHDRFTYSAGPGLAVQYAQPNPALGGSGYKFLGDFSHEALWKLTDRLSIKHTGSYLFKPQDMKDYRLRANSALVGKMSEQITLNLRYEYEFEAIRPVVSGRSDHRVFTTLGYSF